MSPCTIFITSIAGALPSIAFFKCIRLFSILLIALVIVVLVEAWKVFTEDDKELLADDVGFR